MAAVGTREIGKSRRRAGTPEPPRGCEVIEPAGRGTFCDVWKIRDLDSGEFFALKQLRPEWRTETLAQRVLGREATVGSRVRGEFVAKVFDEAPTGRRRSLVVEWLEGESLESRLQAKGRHSEREGVWIARQCVQGLLELQEAGFSHGDLKPENIFITPRGQVKLVDLGFARPLTGERTADRDGLFTGTAEYLAPESLSSEPHSPVDRDVYSLGVVLFRMLAGRLPFTADSTREMLALHKQRRAPLLRRWRPEASRELAGLVSRMLAKHPLRRPGDLRLLVRELLGLELGLLGG